MCARPYLRKTLLLFIPSIIFVVLNMILVARRSSGPYSIHIDWLIPVTFSAYRLTTLVPINVEDFTPFAEWGVQAGAIVITLALAGFVAMAGMVRSELASRVSIFVVRTGACGCAATTRTILAVLSDCGQHGLAMLASIRVIGRVQGYAAARWLWH